MLVALIVTAFGAGIHLPGAAGRIDPARLAETFETGVRQVAVG